MKTLHISKHGTPDSHPQYGIYEEGERNDFVIVKGTEERAQFIVTACNSFQDMYEALEAIADENPEEISDRDGLIRCTDIARTALKKARRE